MDDATGLPLWVKKMSNSLRWDFQGATLDIVQGDITRAEVDAVVNAANVRLAGGGGVDGAIHRAAGPKLLRACRQYVEAHGIIAPGDAVSTPGFNMKAKHIIHTAGPIWAGGGSGEEHTLRKAY